MVESEDGERVYNYKLSSVLILNYALKNWQWCSLDRFCTQYVICQLHVGLSCYHVAIKSNTMNCFFVLFPLRLTPITVDILGGRFSVCNSKKFVIMGYKRNKHLFCFLTYEIKFPQTRKRSGCKQKISYVHTQLKNGFFISLFHNVGS